MIVASKLLQFLPLICNKTGKFTRKLFCYGLSLAI